MNRQHHQAEKCWSTLRNRSLEISARLRPQLQSGFWESAKFNQPPSLHALSDLHASATRCPIRRRQHIIESTAVFPKCCVDGLELMSCRFHIDGFFSSRALIHCQRALSICYLAIVILKANTRLAEAFHTASQRQAAIRHYILGELSLAGLDVGELYASR